MLKKSLPVVIAFLLAASCNVPSTVTSDKGEYFISAISGRKIYKKNIISSEPLINFNVKNFLKEKKQKMLDKNFSAKYINSTYGGNCYEVYCNSQYDCHEAHGIQTPCGNCSLWDQLPCGANQDDTAYCYTQYKDYYNYLGDNSQNSNDNIFPPVASLSCDQACPPGNHVVVQNGGYGYTCEQNTNVEICSPKIDSLGNSYNSCFSCPPGQNIVFVDGQATNSCQPNGSTTNQDYFVDDTHNYQFGIEGLNRAAVHEPKCVSK